MKINDYVEFTTPLGQVMTGTIISMYVNTATGNQIASIKVENPISTFDTYGIDIANVRVLKAFATKGRVNQLQKSLAIFESRKQALIESGEALKRKGELNRIEKTIQLRKKQLEELQSV